MLRQTCAVAGWRHPSRRPDRPSHLPAGGPPRGAAAAIRVEFPEQDRLLLRVILGKIREILLVDRFQVGDLTFDPTDWFEFGLFEFGPECSRIASRLPVRHALAIAFGRGRGTLGAVLLLQVLLELIISAPQGTRGPTGGKTRRARRIHVGIVLVIVRPEGVGAEALGAVAKAPAALPRSRGPRAEIESTVRESWSFLGLPLKASDSRRRIILYCINQIVLRYHLLPIVKPVNGKNRSGAPEDPVCAVEPYVNSRGCSIVATFSRAGGNAQWIGYDCVLCAIESGLDAIPAETSLRVGETGRVRNAEHLALLLLVGLGQVQGSEARTDAAALVLELGGRYADRQAAALALERIGAPAIEALREGRALRDMEVKTRSSSLLLKIETALLTEPTTVRLDFDGTLLSEVAESLSRQTGFKIALSSESAAVEESACDAAQRSAAQLLESRRRALRCGFPAIQSIDAKLWRSSRACIHFDRGRGPYAHADLGSGAVSGAAALRRLSASADVRLRWTRADRRTPPPRPAARIGQPRDAAGPGRLNPITTVQFTAQLLVAAEPRLALIQRGDLRLLEAVDNRGNSLIPVGRRGQSLGFAGYFGNPHGSVMESHVQLLRPTVPGDLIKKLRGNRSRSPSHRGDLTLWSFRSRRVPARRSRTPTCS